jgi:hypothetical protein
MALIPRLVGDRRFAVLRQVSLAVGLLAGYCTTAFAAADDLFESKIRPVLSGTCLGCHGDRKQSGQLRVDSREALLRGGDSGPAIVPGHPEESLLIAAVRRSDDVAAMPPETSLRRDQVEALELWIRDGAVWPTKAAPFTPHRHWAFEDSERLNLACRILFGRSASSWDRDDFSVFRDQYVEALPNVAPSERERSVWQAYVRVLFSSNELLWVD